MHNHHPIEEPALNCTAVIAVYHSQILVHEELGDICVCEDGHRREQFLLFLEVEQVVLLHHQFVVHYVYVVEQLDCLQKVLVVTVAFNCLF